MEGKYEIEGYVFRSKQDFDRAQKERETIMYLTANTNMTDMKAVYQIYKRSVAKGSFQTIFGLNFLEELRQRLLGSGTVTVDLLEPIPVGKIVTVAAKAVKTEDERKYDALKEAYEKAQSGKIIKNFLIVILVIVVGVMLLSSYQSQYSIFTYFTNYKEQMREELTDEYETWEKDLQQREAAVERREAALENSQ